MVIRAWQLLTQPSLVAHYDNKGTGENVLENSLPWDYTNILYTVPSKMNCLLLHSKSWQFILLGTVYVQEKV